MIAEKNRASAVRCQQWPPGLIHSARSILRRCERYSSLLNGSNQRITEFKQTRRSTYEERAEALQHVQGQDQEDVHGRRHHQEDDRHLPRRHRRRLWAVC